MTIEPTAGEPTAADAAPVTEASADAPKPAQPAGSAEPGKAKVTTARAKTSGPAPRGRPKAQPSAIVPGTEPPAGPETVRADHVEITQGGASSVHATTVSVSQGGIGTADARTIDVRQGGIGSASATDIAVSGGSIGLARGERVSLEMGAVVAAIGDDVRVTQSMSSFVAARGEVTVDQSLVGTLVGDKVTLRQPSAVFLLIARQVDGTVRPLLDWRGALAAGAVAGVVIGVLRRVRR